MTEGWWVPAITGTIFVAVSGYLFSRPTPLEAAIQPVDGDAAAAAQADANSPAR